MMNRGWKMARGLLVPESNLIGADAGIMCSGSSPVLNRVLACHFDTDYTDLHGHTLSGSGPSISASTKKFGAGSFYSNSATIATAASTDFAVDFLTLQFWFYNPAAAATFADHDIVTISDGSSTLKVYWRDDGSTSTYAFRVSKSSPGYVSTILSGYSINTWYYLTLQVEVNSTVRTHRFFVDGVHKYSSAPAAMTLGSTTVTIGGNRNIYVDDLELYKVSKGYTSGGFTPPTSAFPDSA